MKTTPKQSGKGDNTPATPNESREKLENSNVSAEVTPPAPALDLTAAALDEVAGKMPAPNPDVETLTAAPESAPGAAALDDTAAFNPEIHETGADGKPVLTPTGRFKKKKGMGRAALTVPQTDNAEAKRREMIAAQRNMAAQVIVNTFISTGVMVFGDEWQPETQKAVMEGKEISISEKDILVTTTEQYLESKNVVDIPPGVCLAIVFSSYCLKRAGKPETKRRLMALFGGLKGKIAGAFGRLRGMFGRKK